MFNHIEKLENLRALLLLQPAIQEFQQTYKSTSMIYKIPPGIFSKLKHLQVLNLSGFPIIDLPSSIGETKELRYLDLSYTLIELLPVTICLLSNLETLKLRGCVRLVRLPEGIIKLTSLLHLDLNILSQLSLLPKGIGKLTALETLSAFLVDKEYGRRINELGYMNNLEGSLCISQLERVSNSSEAKEAALSHKKHLKRLELRWSAPRLSRKKNQELEYEVLDNLCPPSSIEDLEISGYGGLIFPNWIGDSKVLHMLLA
ncbi:disease resistance protein RGA2-like [Chenopodium quinoa]|uniref:disease resistance protein RGA2-like n=1 Tax=Chenopodium quinoa TaxID=63459 RepID=UPI000B7862F8|nr:disease resistance protein RGA2-like [Chenopodium quinoa]